MDLEPEGGSLPTPCAETNVQMDIQVPVSGTNIKRNDYAKVKVLVTIRKAKGRNPALHSWALERPSNFSALSTVCCSCVQSSPGPVAASEEAQRQCSGSPC